MSSTCIDCEEAIFDGGFCDNHKPAQPMTNHTNIEAEQIMGKVLRVYFGHNGVVTVGNFGEASEELAKLINQEITRARIEERVMQGEENNSDYYREARLTQLKKELEEN